MTAKKEKTLIISFLLLVTAIYYSVSISAQNYQVRPGDSLYLISRNFGTSVDAIRTANNLWSNTIYPGQVLFIPQGGGSSMTTYTVRPGDSLYFIARRYNLSVNDLRQANNIWHDEIWVGQTIYLPRTSSSSTGSNQGIYTVRPADTLYLIARQYGTTVAALKAENNLTGNTIYPGQQLVIPKSSPEAPSSGQAGLSASDLDLLARLVRAEAEGEPYEGMVAVAATVMNRLRDPRYPNSIPEIIYQYVNGLPQYSPVQDGRINLPATSIAKKAVQDAVNGWDPSKGATGFYNPDKTTNSWVRSHPVTVRIGDHVFFKY